MDTPIITQPRQPLYTEPATPRALPPGSVVPTPQESVRTPPDPDPGPRDIAYLHEREELRVYQEFDEYDAAFLKTAFDRYNVYAICNERDEACYFAKEKSPTAWRICMQQRPMQVNVKDNYGSVVMRLDRPWRCRASWLCCCHLQEMYIERPIGIVLATVIERWTCWRPEFDISITNDTGGFVVRGAWSSCRCASMNRFYVYNRSDEKVAVIYKQYEHCIERCAMINDFRVKYLSGTLTSQDKLLILGTAFLIDFNYLELKV